MDIESTRKLDPNVAKVCVMTGMTPRQVLRLVRKGCIPGTIIGTRLVMTPGQFEQLDREGVKPEPKEPKPAREVPTPIRDPDPNDFLKTTKRAS